MNYDIVESTAAVTYRSLMIRLAIRRLIDKCKAIVGFDRMSVRERIDAMLEKNS